jgi:hypothetical protein
VPTPPWTRRKHEGSEAYAAFLRYRDLGPERSLEAVHQGFSKGSTKSVRLLARWSSRWEWVDRVRSWDDHLQVERDRVRLTHARKWEERAEEAREAKYQDAKGLRSKAAEMLRFPLAEVRGERDGKPVVVQPGKWTFDSATRILRLSADLEAEAIGVSVAPAETTAALEGGDARSVAIAAAMLDAGQAAALAASGAPPDDPPPNDLGALHDGPGEPI